ncbi:MAG: ABC transporter substrate-binding protein [Thermomicrobiales bacterium]
MDLPQTCCSRRAILQAVCLAGASLGAPRMTAAQAATPDPATGWTFTDDAGKTVTLGAMPQRVAADLTAAAALWDFGIRPVAVSGDPWNLGMDAAWGRVPRNTPVLSTRADSGAPDLQKLIAVAPDLFVTLTWGDPNSPYARSFPGTETYDLVNAVAPVVAISAAGNAGQNVERFAELAVLLGAEPDAPEVEMARAAYEQAVAAFAAVAAEKSDVRVMFIYAEADGTVVANPEDWAELSFYQSLGLNIIKPNVPEGSYWEGLSAELVGKYPADLLLQSTHAGLVTHDQFASHPAFGTLPAVKAGQIGVWDVDVIQSYQGLTAALKKLTDTLRTAEPVAD